MSEALVTIINDKYEKYPLSGEFEPATYSGTTITMIDEGTSVSGHLLGAVIREEVAHISMSWRYLTKEQWAHINGLFKTDAKDGSRYVNIVRFFNQTSGEWEEREMYVSDRSAGLWRRNPQGGIEGWVDCSLELTEV